jgi:hypothetical protein
MKFKNLAGTDVPEIAHLCKPAEHFMMRKQTVV